MKDLKEGDRSSSSRLFIWNPTKNKTPRGGGGSFDKLVAIKQVSKY